MVLEESLAAFPSLSSQKMEGYPKNLIDPREEDLSETSHDPPSSDQKARQEEEERRLLSQEAREKMQEHKQQRDDESEVLSDYSQRSKGGGMGSVRAHNRDTTNAAASRWKCISLGVLLSLGLFVTVSAWVVLTQCDEDNLEAKFTLAATQIQDGVKSRSRLLVEALQVESQTLSDLAEAREVTWPFYVPVSFERRAQHIREITGLQSLGLATLVDEGTLDVWNRFVKFHSRNSSDPVGPVYRFESGLRSPYTPSTVFAPRRSDGFWRHYMSSNKTVFAPIWSLSPLPLDSSIINYDVLSNDNTQELFHEMTDTGSMVISDILDFSHVTHHLHNQNNDNERYDNEMPPHSLVFQPIYDTGAPSPSSKPVAVLFGVLSWHSYLNNLLPNATKGIVCEFHNSCGQSIQFSLNEGNVALLHRGSAPKEPSENPLYKIPFLQGHEDSGSCKYTLYVYPSTQFRSDNESDKPAVYTATLALLFLLAAVIIFWGIRAIRRRQNEILSFASETNQIMANLFPSNFWTPSTQFKDNVSVAKDKRVLPTSTSQRSLLGKIEEGADNSEVQIMDDSLISFASRRSHTAGGLSRGGLSGSGGPLSLTRTNSQRHMGKVQNLTIDEECSHTGGGLSLGGLSIMSRGGLSYSSSQNRRKHQLALMEAFADRPIADLFPEATVLNADIVGFTAWSSSREPFHVFELLESLYSTFDGIARTHDVFKVETMGDCYTAVTGVPFPNENHAVAMAVFARKICIAMDNITQTLEVTLGPETSDLGMRIGIHSGPVTAGVLRGDRNRFQMFGDTVSRAAKIEGDGEPGRILISKETADLLTAAGKSGWFTPREKRVRFSGGVSEVFWLTASEDEEESEKCLNKELYFHPALVKADELINRMDENCLIKTKHQRLIDWIVDQMKVLLKEVVAQRKHLQLSEAEAEMELRKTPQSAVAQSEVCVFDEVKEVIEMPQFDVATVIKVKNADDIELSPDVIWQLHDYVTSISTMYNDNPFHNFEHAGHVTMTVIKMLSRVVCPTDYGDLMKEEMQGKKKRTTSKKRSDSTRSSTKKNVFELHDFSYGISSDPLSQFALVFGALIHDVDHVGVSNAQLVKEGSRLARIYKSQSVAEQNSVNIGWDLLMDPAFEALRKCIYTNNHEYTRFRATVVNVVMATDIVDKDLKVLRNARWDKAFSKEAGEDKSKVDLDRMATLVLEHLIQASDVSHTMQHWHVYQKWNHKLFRELYIAHKKGRMAGNPADFWYKGEIGFFDFYIIPLAKKLRDCGVFGVSCDEFLNYACDNRAQWVEQGEDVVRELIKSVETDKDIQRIIEQHQSSQQVPEKGTG